MEDSVESCIEVKEDYIHHSFLVYQASHFIIAGYQHGQAGLPLSESMMTTASCPSCAWKLLPGLAALSLS